MSRSRVGAIAPQPVQVSHADEGEISIQVASHARRLPLPDRKDPYILDGPQSAVLGVHPPPPTRIRHPCACPCRLWCPALRPASCQLPARKMGLSLPRTSSQAGQAAASTVLAVTARPWDSLDSSLLALGSIFLDPLNPAVRHTDVRMRARKGPSPGTASTRTKHASLHGNVLEQAQRHCLPPCKPAGYLGA